MSQGTHASWIYSHIMHKLEGRFSNYAPRSQNESPLEAGTVAGAWSEHLLSYPFYVFGMHLRREGLVYLSICR